MERVGRDISDGLELAPGLSEFDRALIRLLQDNGRKSYADIARELGTTGKVVRKRVAELRAHGIIRITTIGDPDLMGYGVVALVGVVVDSTAAVKEVAEELAMVAGAFYVMVVTGRYNVLVELSCRDTDHLLEVLSTEIPRVRGVGAIEVFPYLRLQYQNPSFEAAREKASASGERPQRITFDDTDREIIARLHDDGRVPFLSIAQDLKISESQVRHRVKRMVGSGALRVMALTIPRGVGFETVALVALGVSPGVEVEHIATRLAELPAVIYVAICAGRFDIFAEVVCTDREDLLRLLDSEIRALEGVSASEAWIYLRLHYRSVRPAPNE